MGKEKYLEDLKEIKDIMNRTSRFISLSGLSGVSTGLTALAGAYLAYRFIFRDHDYLVYDAVDISSKILRDLLFIAIGTLFVSILGATFFTRRKSKQQNQLVLDIPTKRLLFHLLIPLITGGVFCLMLLLKGFVGMILPLTLIFYGLALVNGSKYTLPEIRNLGLIEIVLGLLAFQWISYGLLFWALGFGVVQMIYGLIVQKKY